MAAQQPPEEHHRYGATPLDKEVEKYAANRRALAEAAATANAIDDLDTRSKLEVTIVSARNLKDKEKLGHVNPMCKLQFGLLPVQTTKTLKDTLNPEWNETFTFDINAHGKTAFFIYVWGKHKLKKDKFLGVVTTTYRHLLENPVQGPTWHTLEKRSEKSRISGELCFSYRLTRL